MRIDSEVLFTRYPALIRYPRIIAFPGRRMSVACRANVGKEAAAGVGATFRRHAPVILHPCTDPLQSQACCYSSVARQPRRRQHHTLQVATSQPSGTLRCLMTVNSPT